MGRSWLERWVFYHVRCLMTHSDSRFHVFVEYVYASLVCDMLKGYFPCDCKNSATKMFIENRGGPRKANIVPYVLLARRGSGRFCKHQCSSSEHRLLNAFLDSACQNLVSKYSCMYSAYAHEGFYQTSHHLQTAVFISFVF